jgi:hypothetical protein
MVRSSTSVVQTALKTAHFYLFYPTIPFLFKTEFYIIIITTTIIVIYKG